MNCRHFFQTLSRYTSRLHPPAPSVTFSRHLPNCILFHQVFLCCPISPLWYSTSYSTYPYILRSTFSNFTSSSSTWNLRPGRWGITIHRRIKRPTLREHLHVHWRRQPIFMADHMFELPTQPSSIVLEITNVRAIIFINQDDNDTDREISKNESEDPGECTLSSNIEEADLHNQTEVQHLDQACHDRLHELQGFHSQRNGAVRILSLHAFHFQICNIRPGPSHYHCSSAKSQPSTYYASLMLYLPRRFLFQRLVETRMFLNQRPAEIRMFLNNKRPLLR